jgi:hypothetical protein
MSKAEIIAELSQMNPEDLAEVRVFLDRLTAQRLISKPSSRASGPPRVYSPRLADPTKAGDFKKQVIDG